MTEAGGLVQVADNNYQGLKYKIIITPLLEKDGGGWLSTHPELDGCMSDGETPEEAIRNLADARVSWIEARIMDGLPIPAPEIKEDDE